MEGASKVVDAPSLCFYARSVKPMPCFVFSTGIMAAASDMSAAIMTGSEGEDAELVSMRDESTGIRALSINCSIQRALLKLRSRQAERLEMNDIKLLDASSVKQMS